MKKILLLSVLITAAIGGACSTTANTNMANKNGNTAVVVNSNLSNGGNMSNGNSMSNRP